MRSPLVDLRLFLNPRFTWSVLVGMVMGFALLGVLFVFTPFLQIVQANDAQATGVRLLPLIGGIVLGAVGSDRLVARLGVRVMLVLGLLICAVGMSLLSLVKADSGFGLMAVALPVIGVAVHFTQRHPRHPAREADRSGKRPEPDPPTTRRLIWRRHPWQHPQQRLPS
ncbi:MAG TPA: hypothetical protein VGK42_01235 [Candidatus Dormibacteraeota bacterium]